MSNTFNTKKPCKVKRTSGDEKSGYFQYLVKYKDKVYAIVTWTDANGGKARNEGNAGKFVPIKQFVELNPEYEYLIPKPDAITFTFSPKQLEAFQECHDCPPCFQDIKCDSDM
jgi:hypothetical protein